MTKKIIVAGNWKMNKTYLEAKEFVAKMNQLPELKTETIIAVPSVYVDTLFANNQKANINLTVQNCSGYEGGAYTGEVSAKMLASLNIKYCIVGHSERRQYFGETDNQISEKVDQLLKQNLRPILCIGETLDQRNAEETFNILRHQLTKGVKTITKENATKLIVAYEPVWAIGTGLTATKEQAQEVHKFIYNILADVFDAEIASQIPILYGGSCNEANAEELFSQPNIWGGLIGGASLKIDTFYQIMQIAEKLNG
jgi:triosephosphate isomerase (TIM)